MKYRKKPIEVDATQWWTNGDHPDDFDGEDFGDRLEGKVVRYFRDPSVPGPRTCGECSRIMHDHGWIDTREGGHIVCPGDWIITDVRVESDRHGYRYPCKPAVFSATYESKSQAGALAIREPFAKGRDHLTESGTFQSDKFPWCSAGFVPLKITDPAARDLLAEYARRREPIDAAFPRDLLEALENIPAKPNPKYLPFPTVDKLAETILHLDCGNPFPLGDLTYKDMVRPVDPDTTVEAFELPDPEEETEKVDRMEREARPDDLEQARADWATADAIYDELQIIEDWPEDSQDIRAGARDVIRKALADARAGD